MKVRTTTDAVIGFTLMTAVALSIIPFNVSTFGQDMGVPNPQSQTHKPAWLDGSGKDVRIKVTGEIFDENGAPADRYKLEVRLETRFGERDLPVKIERNRFGVWVPVGSADGFTLHLNAASADGRQIARIPVSIHELRQAAIDGLTMKMKKPERLIEIKVVANGRTVPDASVAAEFAGDRIIGKTNSAGVATFPVMNRDKLSQLTAWSDDFRIGGYSLDRDPPRDPMGDKFSIELDRCRPQTIRIINDEDRSPVPNLGFVLTIMTGPPDYQFPGETPDRAMRSDANGEAVYRWFPDWKKHHSYVEITDPRWVKATDEHVVDVVRVRKSQFDKRKRIAGTVASADGNVAGFAVSISSFQGEEKNQLDVLYAVTDEHGDFAADYLPGATYCICINDARFVSNIIDLIPYEPTTRKTTRPSLNISTGQPVEIVVTAGAEKRPVAHQCIGLETPHDYSWREEGRTQNGSGGRRWQVFTNEQGKANTFALPGRELKGSLYSPEWRTEESVQVKTVGVTRLEFHQKVAAKRKLVGRLRLADNLDTSLKDAVVEIASIDGETNERQTLNANPDGQFAFQSQASRIGIYARTKDAKAAGVSIVDHLDKPIELQLRPTGEFRGQLLGKENHPLQGHAVRAVLYVSGKRDDSNGFPKGFYAATFESKTDAEGNYSLTGLPREVVLSLRADSIDGSDRESSLEEFYLVPNESRPRTVSRLWKPQTTSSFSERYAKTLRDCRLSDFCAMVILFRPSDDTTRFVDANLMDYEKTREVMSFIQLQGQVGDDAATDKTTGFVRSKNWPMPEKGKVLACALDPTGKELGRVEFDSKDPEGPTQAAQFIRKHAPKPVNAREKWDKAFAVAKQMNRKVWVRVSGNYCGPCFRLARWLDDEKEILEQDYVLLKIDYVRDLHGYEVAKRVTGGEQYGVPFCAIFDTDGRMLINSNSTLGNIGYPSGFEGKKHLRRMLMETHNRLTEKQIEEIVASLND